MRITNQQQIRVRSSCRSLSSLITKSKYPRQNPVLLRKPMPQNPLENPVLLQKLYHIIHKKNQSPFRKLNHKIHPDIMTNSTTKSSCPGTIYHKIHQQNPAFQKTWYITNSPEKCSPPENRITKSTREIQSSRKPYHKPHQRNPILPKFVSQNSLETFCPPEILDHRIHQKNPVLQKT